MEQKRKLFIIFMLLALCNGISLIIQAVLIYKQQIHLSIPIFTFILFCVSFLMAFWTFARYTNCYFRTPLSCCFREVFSKKEELSDGNYQIILVHKGKGIWMLGDKIAFDLRGYLFPKMYLCSYFVRNFHYPIMNKKKLPLKCLFEPLKIEKICSFNIVFVDGKKKKTAAIIKKGKTVVPFFRGLTIQSRFYAETLLCTETVFGKHVFRKYIYMDEDIYNRR